MKAILIYETSPKHPIYRKQLVSQELQEPPNPVIATYSTSTLISHLSRINHLGNLDVFLYSAGNPRIVNCVFFCCPDRSKHMWRRLNRMMNKAGFVGLSTFPVFRECHVLVVGPFKRNDGIIS